MRTERNLTPWQWYVLALWNCLNVFRLKKHRGLSDPHDACGPRSPLLDFQGQWPPHLESRTTSSDVSHMQSIPKVALHHSVVLLLYPVLVFCSLSLRSCRDIRN